MNIENETEKNITLPKILPKEISVDDNFYKMAFKFQEIMMIYESASKQIETKLEILNKEYAKMIQVSRALKRFQKDWEKRYGY